MSERTDKAIAKITEEMMALESPIAQGVEEYLTGKCLNDDIADKILDPGKTLKGATDALWDEAKKRKKGNCAYIPPEEAFAIVDKYYELHEAAVSEQAGEVDLLSLF